MIFKPDLAGIQLFYAISMYVWGWRNDISRAVSLKLPWAACFVSEVSVTTLPNYG